MHNHLTIGCRPVTCAACAQVTSDLRASRQARVSKPEVLLVASAS